MEERRSKENFLCSLTPAMNKQLVLLSKKYGVPKNFIVELGLRVLSKKDTENGSIF